MPFDSIGIAATGALPVGFNLLSTGKYAQVVQVNIGTVGGAETPLIQGQAVMTASLPVVLASDHSNINVAGPAASDAPVSGNPLVVAGRASAAAPTDVSADGDVVAAWRLRNGAGAVVLTAAGALIGGDATNGLDVDVTRLSTEIVDNAGFTDGTTKLVPVAFIFDDVAGTALTENDAAAARIDSKRSQMVVLEDATTRGQKLAISAAGAASVNMTQIGGVSISVGAGAVGTGVQRVTWCSDSPANVVDNAGFTDGTTGLVMHGFIFDETAGTGLTENDAAAARVDSKRAQVMVLEDGTTRGTRASVTAQGLQVETRGPVAADQPTTSNPVPMAGRASAAAPADVSADGDAVHAWHLRNGAAAVVLTAAGNLMTAGAGAVAAGTPRVTLASDDPAVTALANPTSVARLLSAAASTNATNAKNGAGRVFTIIGVNNAGAARFLKLYNKASSPTVGTDTPVATFQLPALQSFAIDIPRGLTFATGISYALTTAAADADTGALTAGDVTCLNIMYS